MSFFVTRRQVFVTFLCVLISVLLSGCEFGEETNKEDAKQGSASVADKDKKCTYFMRDEGSQQFLFLQFHFVALKVAF